VGNELESTSIKAYRVNRIIGDVKRGSRSETFTVPDGFNVSDYLIMTKTTGDEPCVIKVKKGSCLNLRAMSRVITDNDGFDILEIHQVQRAELVRTLLWSGPDAEVISPQDIRDEVRSSLERLLAR
jgi:predicted DNA-binding transcriptional regulator YafY